MNDRSESKAFTKLVIAAAAVNERLLARMLRIMERNEHAQDANRSEGTAGNATSAAPEGMADAERSV